jgi:DNA polymerase-1
MGKLDTCLEKLQTLAWPYLPPGQKKKKLRDYDKDQKDEAGNIIEKAYKEVFEEIPRKFNPGSPDQVKAVLKNMGVRVPFKNGRETTDEVALLKVNRKYGLPIVPLLLEYREANKLKTTYCAIPLESDGKIRFTLGIAGTKTGRFNSNRTPWDTGCNAQNLPKEFRAVVVADPGKTLVQVDLSQAELRVVAWKTRS